MTLNRTPMVSQAAQRDIPATGRHWDPIRQVVLIGLAIALAPAAIAVLLVGVVGLIVCATMRVVDPRRPMATSLQGARPDPAAAAPGRPYARAGRIRAMPR